MPERRIMLLEEWKSKILKGEDPPKDIKLIKSVPIPETKALDDEGNLFRFVISTDSVDREKDTIATTGWKIDNWKANPVVLWAHNYRALPVAGGRNLTIEEHRVLSDADFSESRKLDPFAETVRGYVAAKLLRTSSVGFDPFKWIINEERRGWDFIEQELLEWSIVPVPANPEAVQLARSLKIDNKPLRDWAMQVLDEWSEEKGIYVARSLVEKTVKWADDKKSVSILIPSEEFTRAFGESLTPAEPDPAPVVGISEKLDQLIEVCKGLKFAPPPDPETVRTHDDVGDEPVLLLADDTDEGRGETDPHGAESISLDPEEIKQAIRESVAPLVMQLTGRVF
ncbi:MAG TPA: hypothetical protein VNL14_16720 [Candidatus Acidoferrales bacterium]|nr:hypothetical protein [Candidatus Acidoferrales bacterium]